jgi:phage tail sheath gpL-like
MSGTTIGFEEIPLDWRVPGVYLETRPDRRRQGLVPYPARTLIVAPRLGTGPGITAGTGPLNTPLRLTRLEEAIAWGGPGGIAHQMAEAFLANNRTGNVSLFLVDEPSGARATATITFTGTVTGAGTFTTLIAGNRVSIPVAPAETVSVIAARLVSAIAANPNLPVAAASTAGVVTLTCKQLGTIGNGLPLSHTPDATVPLPAGLAVAVTAFAGGTGEASYVPVLASALATDWWTDVVFPELTTTMMATLPAELDRRWNAMERLDTHVWAARSDSFANLSTWGNACNSRFISEIGFNGGPSPRWVWAAALAGRATFFLLNDPARQLRSIPLVGVQPPPLSSRFTDTERDLLLRDGISTFTVTDDGAVVIERVVTHYQRTTLNVEDTAWLDVMTPKVLSRIRYDWAAYMTQTWPRAKLADDGAPAAEFDPEVATPRRLHASWAARCALYERQGWIQQATESAAESLFTRDVNDRNRVNARQYVRVLGNLMTLAGVLEFSQ